MDFIESIKTIYFRKIVACCLTLMMKMSNNVNISTFKIDVPENKEHARFILLAMHFSRGNWNEVDSNEVASVATAALSSSSGGHNVAVVLSC